jgi:hypothetical protein
VEVTKIIRNNLGDNSRGNLRLIENLMDNKSENIGKKPRQIE